MRPLKTLLLAVILLLAAASVVNAINPIARFASKLKSRVEDGRRKKLARRKSASAEPEKEGGAKFAGFPRLSDSMTVFVPAAALIVLLVAGLRHGKKEEARLQRQLEAEARQIDAAVLTPKSIPKSASSLDMTVATENESDVSDTDSSGDDDEGQQSMVPRTPPPSPTASFVESSEEKKVDGEVKKTEGVREEKTKKDAEAEAAEEEEAKKKAEAMEKERREEEAAARLLAILQDEAAVMAREASQRDLAGMAAPKAAGQDTEAKSSKDGLDDESDSDDEDDAALVAALEAEAAAKAKEAEDAIDAAETAVGEIDSVNPGMNESAHELRMSLRKSSSMLQMAEC